jgi:hypothetical protein
MITLVIKWVTFILSFIMLSKSTGVGIALTVAWDVYEYGWGSKREVGLQSPEFAAAVTVDVVVSAGFPAAGAALGTLCGPGAPFCVPAGTALGSFAAVAFSRNVFGLREMSIEALSGFYEAIWQQATQPKDIEPVIIEWDPSWGAPP